MPTTEHKAPGAALRARIDERFIAPFQRHAFANRTWFSVTVALVLALHAGAIGYFLYRDMKDPAADPKQAEETPVEIVVEKPQEAPKLPRAQQQKQEIEKPASSAPRAESDTKVDTAKVDSEMTAPKAETPPQDGQPQPAEDAAEPNLDTDNQDMADAAAANPDDSKNAEALDKAAPTPTKGPPKPAKAKVASKQKRPKSAQQQMAALSDLPEYHFAKRTKKSPISGGTEDSRYLAIVYGLITAQLHPVGVGSVTAAFELDESGNVIGIGLSRPSGDDLADAEVVNAIRRASPFPPPPPDRPHSLTATIDFSRDHRPLSMGEQ